MPLSFASSFCFTSQLFTNYFIKNTNQNKCKLLIQMRMHLSHIYLLLSILTTCNLKAFGKPPNIVFFLTDDLDSILGGLTPLKSTVKMIAHNGVTFMNAFATTPLCCPSRSSLLTGLYMHSHKTFNNSLSGGCSDSRWQSKYEPNTFARILRDSGYQTFYAGKYLNQYGHKSTGGPQHVPPGWDWWVGLVGNSVYYNYTLSVNGTPVFRGDKQSDYLTDVLKEYSMEFLKGARQPFLFVVSPPSPHEPFTPAERHKGIYSRGKAPRTPNFNVPVKEKKHWLLRLPPKTLPKTTVQKIDEVFRNRWETLISVDELIHAVFSSLRRLKVLENTYILFTSDHGFHLGQFGLPWDKRQPYETDIRIPMMLRGPGVPIKTVHHSVLNIDLAPTFLDMAGVLTKGSFGEGRSFLPFLESLHTDERFRGFLIEYKGEGQKKNSNSCYPDSKLKLCSSEASCKCFDSTNNTYTCVRRHSKFVDDIYCEFQDNESFKEFYDLTKDPYQIRNIINVTDTKTQRQMLNCCNQKIILNKPIDICFVM